MSWKRSNCSGIRSVRFILRIEGKYPDDKAKICADGSLSYAAETGRGYIHIKEILDLLKEQNYPGNVIVELYDYSPEHMRGRCIERIVTRLLLAELARRHTEVFSELQIEI